MSVSAVPLRGKLEEHSFSEVLRALLSERRDGCLTVARGAIIRRIYLRGGMIVYGSSTERQDRLGEILIAQGKLSKADHKKYWEQSQSGNRLLGITLVLNGRITLSDLYQGVTAQVVTILDRVQKWRKGDYEFEVGREPRPGTVLLRIPLALYLRADSEKRPAARKAATKKPAARAGAQQKLAAAPAVEVPAVDAAATGAGEAEQVLEIHDDGPDTAAALSQETAKDLDCLGEVSFMVQELRMRVGQGPYALLGLPPGADHPSVQAAYHRIAKVLHPDKFPKICSPELAQEADEVFREVTAAFQAAEDENRRAAATPAAVAAAAPPPLRRGGQPPPEEEQARRFFAQGREWISKRNYWQAADALRQAVRLKPTDAVYRQYLGLALMQTKRLHEAEEHLVEATRLEPNNAAHFVNLGRIYRGGRLIKKAREAFERALRIDPREEHAREELNDLPEEQQPARKPESVSILKKLFGKG